ncbi:kinase-like domain-containing protein [Aspergillus californicus]
MAAPRETEEGSQVYRPGGFHPVFIGWIYHEKDESFKALKVLSAECYGGQKDIYEHEILEHLRDADPSHLGYPYISKLVGSFEHDGPNGRHVCLVFPVMGETFRSFGTWFPDDRVPDIIMRTFTGQLLMALDYAHDSGVIHTDIKPDNIIVQLTDESLITSSYLPNTPSDPASQPLGRHYVRNGGSFLDCNVALGDWGVASWSDKHLSEFIQPVALRSPEVLIGAPWDYITDLWNLGAVVYEVSRAIRLFSGRVPPDGRYDVRKHLHEIFRFFGPFPRSFLERGDQKLVEEYFDDEGRVKGLEPLKALSLESELMMPDLKEEARAKFATFLKKLMKIDPKKRKTTMKLLADPWLGFAKVVDDDDSN